MKKTLSVLTAIVLALLSVLPVFADYSTMAVNNTDNNYSSVFGRPDKSHILYENGEYRLVTLAKDSTTLVTERYDRNFKYLGAVSVDIGLPIFGGFYSGSNAYYILSGQKNPTYSDDVEVIRVSKYSKDWQLIDALSLYGFNTSNPFRAGSSAFAECGNYLYIRTCHEGYPANGSSLCHQANMMLELDTRDMSLTDYYNGTPEAFNSGYCSHSLKQFLLIDSDGYLCAADRCDAYPSRGARIGRYLDKAGQPTFGRKFSSGPLYSYKGMFGENETYASMDGFDYSADCYMLVGTYSRKYDYESQRDVILHTMSRTNWSDSGITQRVLYSPEDEEYTPQTAKLVKFSDNRLCIMWEMSWIWSSTKKTGVMYYVFVNSEGEPVTDIMTAEGCYTDCQPVVVNNTAIWYERSNSTTTFFSLTANGVLTKKAAANTHVLPRAGTSVSVSDNTVFTSARGAQTPATFLSGEKISGTPNAFGYYGTGATADGKTVIVDGDLDGDSICDALDVSLAEKYANGHGEAGANEIYAANGSPDEGITVQTYARLVNLAMSG